VADYQGDLSWEGRRARTTVIQSYYDRKVKVALALLSPLFFRIVQLSLSGIIQRRAIVDPLGDDSTHTWTGHRTPILTRVPNVTVPFRNVLSCGKNSCILANHGM